MTTTTNTPGSAQPGSEPTGKKYGVHAMGTWDEYGPIVVGDPNVVPAAEAPTAQPSRKPRNPLTSFSRVTKEHLWNRPVRLFRKIYRPSGR